MTYLQLYYTSSEVGLSGHSGFQFCAMTPGVQREVMREVEKLTVYEQPRLSRDSAQKLDPDGYPTNLMYAYSEATEVIIIARVRFAGLDFSNRSGNYFAHALVTSGTASDLRITFPVELWDAPFWQSEPTGATELPVLSDPLSPGPITRYAVSRFLEETPASRHFLPALLTVADEAMQGGQRALLVGKDSTDVCRWIAAVSYLLGALLAPRLTFSTYCQDPRRSPTHIVGTVSAAGPFNREILASFRRLDPDDPSMADIPPSAAAALLARLGIEVSAGLWDTATSLGAPDSPSLSRWFPVLASAALIREHPLQPDELSAAIDWLASSDATLDAAQLAPAVQGALAHPVDHLSTGRQQLLFQLAQRADNLQTSPSPRLATAVEREHVRWALRHAEGGLPLPDGYHLQTPGAIAMATAGCSRILDSCDADLGVQVLAWASMVGVQPAREAIRRAGRQVLRGMRTDGHAPPRLTEATAAWPDLRAGMVAGLAALPDDQRREMLSSDLTMLFTLTDFAGFPELCEEWIFALVRDGRITRMTGLEQIMQLRRTRRRPAMVDESVITRLWPGRAWTYDEATKALRTFAPAELADEAVSGRVMALLQNIPNEGELHSWIPFIITLNDWLPRKAWPDEQVKLSADLARIAKALSDVDRKQQQLTDPAIDKLIRLYGNCTPTTLAFLNYLLPPKLLLYSRLALVLVRCPSSLLTEFCSYARAEIMQNDLQRAAFIAARVFVAVQDLRDEKRHDHASFLEENVLFPTLPDWKRNDISIVGDEADKLLRHGGRLVSIWYTRHARRGRFFPWRGR